MDEEKKTYDFTGTVTISTEEYRDLIERALRSEFELEMSKNDWFKEYDRAVKAEKELAEIKENRKNYEKFVKSGTEVYEMYMVWLAEKEKGEKE